MAQVESGLLDTVGALFASDAEQKWLAGSCFFMGATSKHGMTQFPYIVTSRHVVEGALVGRESFVRLNRFKRDSPHEAGVEHIPLTGDWRYHPDPTVDLAVLPFFGWDELKQHDVRLNIVFLDRIAGASECLARSNISWPPRSAGEEVCVIGMVLHYTGGQRNIPYVRFGHLALVTDEKITGVYGESDYCLIDYQCYPGNSGSPVWVCYDKPVEGKKALDKELVLLGVLAAGYAEKQEAVEMIGGTAETRTYYNLGISLVTPIQKVVDILNSKELQDVRDELEAL